jgi:hypothetical protein
MSHLAPAVSERNGTTLERSDRRLAELMQEFVSRSRVGRCSSAPLTVPFTSRFRGFDALVSCVWERWRWPALPLCFYRAKLGPSHPVSLW